MLKSLSSGATAYVFDAFGNLAAEYANGTSWSRDYIRWGGGQLIATENAAGTLCTTCYFAYDHLGSVRMVTDASANVKARHDYLPYGEEIAAGVGGRGSLFGVTTDTNVKFTGQLRDQESGQDYFNARYFAAALGRFHSPDPGSAGANLLSSQSWNGYGYVGGNPMISTDPTGTYFVQEGGCYYDKTDFYVDGNYDSSESIFIACAPHGGSGSYGGVSAGGGSAGDRKGTLVKLTTAIRSSIRLKLLNQCTGLAAYTDAAQSLFGTDSLGLAMAMLTPNSAQGAQLLLSVRAGGSGLGTEGSLSGFEGQYQNSSPDNKTYGWNGDQTHHFAAFFQLGFSHPTASNWASIPSLFETAEAWHANTDINQGDVRLGVLAQQLGQQVASGSLPGNQLGNAIRNQACEN